MHTPFARRAAGPRSGHRVGRMIWPGLHVAQDGVAAVLSRAFQCGFLHWPNRSWAMNATTAAKKDLGYSIHLGHQHTRGMQTRMLFLYQPLPS